MQRSPRGAAQQNQAQLILQENVLADVMGQQPAPQGSSSTDSSMQPAQSQEHSSQQQHYQRLQLGMAIIQAPEPDPIWIQRHRDAEATRLWAAHFEKGNNQSIAAAIPSGWANFFTAMLMNQEMFEWAKNFVTSDALPCVDESAGVVDFHILLGGKKFCHFRSN